MLTEAQKLAQKYGQAESQEQKEKQNQEPSQAEIQAAKLSTQLEEANKVRLLEQQNQLEKQQKEKLAELESNSDITNLLNVAKEDLNNDDDKIESLTNKQLLDVIAGAFNTSVEAKLGILTNKIKVDNQEVVNSISQLKNGIVSMYAKMNVDDVAKEFSDFDKMRPAMAIESKKYPGMDMKDIYLLAKAKAVNGTEKVEHTITEKPDTTITGLSPEKQDLRNLNKREETKLNGIAGFRELVQNAAAKIVDESHQNE